MLFKNYVGVCWCCNEDAYEEHHIIPQRSGFNCEEWVKKLTIPLCIKCHNLYHNKINKSDKYKKSISIINLIEAVYKNKASWC